MYTYLGIRQSVLAVVVADKESDCRLQGIQLDAGLYLLFTSRKDVSYISYPVRVYTYRIISQAVYEYTWWYSVYAYDIYHRYDGWWRTRSFIRSLARIRTRMVYNSSTSRKSYVRSDTLFFSRNLRKIICGGCGLRPQEGCRKGSSVGGVARNRKMLRLEAL